MKQYSDFEYTMIAEGCYRLADIDELDVTRELIIESYQHLINTGLAANMHKTFRENAQALIDSGDCHV